MTRKYRTVSQTQSIEAFQSWMKDQLMFPERSKTSEVDKLIFPTKKQSAMQKLAIYQRSYYLRLLKCMREQFPALCHALGEELFNDFSLDYLQQHPSESYTLYDLGNRFPSYLIENRPDKEKAESQQEQWIDFMIDLARFELQLFMMFDARGHEGKPFANQNNNDKDLKLQPCFKLLSYGFNVANYYHSVRNKKYENKHQAISQSTFQVEFPRPENYYVCLVRKNYQTQTITLKSLHYDLLKFLESGYNVPQALVELANNHQLDVDKVLTSWSSEKGIRKQWIDAGFFIVAS